MGVSVSGYCDRFRTPPKYLNRKEIWRCNMNGTGDATGGAIDLCCYLPTGFGKEDLKLFPNEIHFILEQLVYGSNIAATAYAVIIVGNILSDYVTTAGKSGVLTGVTLTAGYAGSFASTSTFNYPFYLGARRAWSLDSPLFVIRIGNTDTKLYDSTAYLSVWDGMPEDLFTGRYTIK